MGEQRIKELKQQLAALNASIARLSAIGEELSQSLADAELRRIKYKRSAVRAKKAAGN